MQNFETPVTNSDGEKYPHDNSQASIFEEGPGREIKLFMIADADGNFNPNYEPFLIDTAIISEEDAKNLALSQKNGEELNVIYLSEIISKYQLELIAYLYEKHKTILTSYGHSELFLAALCRDNEMFKQLVKQYPEQLFISDKSGKATPLDVVLAYEKGLKNLDEMEIIKYLLQEEHINLNTKYSRIVNLDRVSDTFGEIVISDCCDENTIGCLLAENLF